MQKILEWIHRILLFFFPFLMIGFEAGIKIAVNGTYDISFAGPAIAGGGLGLLISATKPSIMEIRADKAVVTKGKDFVLMVLSTVFLVPFLIGWALCVYLGLQTPVPTLTIWLTDYDIQMPLVIGIVMYLAGFILSIVKDG